MNTSIVETKSDKPMEFVPFGAADKIRLTVAIVQNFIAVPTKSGKTCTERDALKFMMLCQAQRLNPFAGDAHLVGYDSQTGPTFSLITAHQAFLKRAETSEYFDGMTSGILIRRGDDTIEEREGDFHLRDELESVVGGWAKVFHKKRSHPTYRKLRMERFNTGFAQWKVDGAGMIVKCAEADALRSTFPTLLGGLFLREEMDIQSTVSTIIPSEAIASLAPLEKPVKPAKQIKASATAEGGNSHDEMQLLLDENDLTFNLLTLWGEETGNIENATSFGTLDEIPSATIKRLLLNKAGLISGLNIAKESTKR